LQKDLQTPAQATPASSAASQGTQMSQGGKDLEALANALSSGDLSGAQQAFASLQQDLQGTGRVRRHHHHHHHGSGSVSSTTPTAGTTTQTDASAAQADSGATPSASSTPSPGATAAVGSALDVQA
jgi:hypothetical protein